VSAPLQRNSVKAGHEVQRVCPMCDKLYQEGHSRKHFTAKKLRFSALSHGFQSLLLHQNFDPNESAEEGRF
jgi:hypothetical protein